MGQRDSSRTRVAPFFDQLLAADPTGLRWLDGLIGLGSRREIVATVLKGQRLVVDHGPRWGKQEFSLRPPATLLTWLVRNVSDESVAASKDTGQTLEKRRKLASRDEQTITEAIAAIQGTRDGRYGKRWYILEGDSKPDALLETDSLVLCIEGKRTESGCTTSTQWMGTRSQLLRHMDAAREHFPAKRVLGLLMVEGEGRAEAINPSTHWISECKAQYGQEMLEASLPHRAPAERAEIGGGILGVATWQAACAALNVDWATLPDTI
jgi:hypothetical protein